MYILYLTLLMIFIDFNGIFAALAVNKIVVRVPNEKDIGLIFDLSIVNTQTEKKEQLEFRIRADGTCCLNLTDNKVMSDASRIVGGNFGYIDVGVTEVVSLIWPTVSLYNRVGFCPISITSTNPKNKQTHIKQILRFDTRFTTLDPEGHNLRKHKNYKDCNNYDKDYLQNCTPVNCEERYFGRRSFYNATSEHCEEVPRCYKPHQLYDYYANECIDTQHYCSEKDIEMIRQGKFDNNYMKWSNQPPSKPNLVVNDVVEKRAAVAAAKMNGNTTTTTTNTHTHDSSNPNSNPANSHHQAHNHVQNHAPTDAPATNVTATTKPDTSNNINDEPWYEFTMPYWLKGLFDGLVIVFATIAIYVLICFVIFLTVTWVSRRHMKSEANKPFSIRTPADSEDNAKIYTPSSLMSTR